MKLIRDFIMILAMLAGYYKLKTANNMKAKFIDKRTPLHIAGCTLVFWLVIVTNDLLGVQVISSEAWYAFGTGAIVWVVGGLYEFIQEYRSQGRNRVSKYDLIWNAIACFVNALILMLT